LLLVSSLNLTKTLFELDLACLFHFELLLVVPLLVVKLTSLTLLSYGRFAEDFLLLTLVGLILQSKSSC